MPYITLQCRLPIDVYTRLSAERDALAAKGRAQTADRPAPYTRFEISYLSERIAEKQGLKGKALAKEVRRAVAEREEAVNAFDRAARYAAAGPSIANLVATILGERYGIAVEPRRPGRPKLPPLAPVVAPAPRSLSITDMIEKAAKQKIAKPLMAKLRRGVRS